MERDWGERLEWRATGEVPAAMKQHLNEQLNEQQPVALRRDEEMASYRAAAASSFSMGAPTRLPHSVHEPS